MQLGFLESTVRAHEHEPEVGRRLLALLELGLERFAAGEHRHLAREPSQKREGHVPDQQPRPDEAILWVLPPGHPEDEATPVQPFQGAPCS